ncbi:MAG: 3-deoxy-D-manno-octulosonic acid transferase [Betaproteobacteria bacterium]
MRWLYSCLMRLAQPALRRKLARRGRAEVGYLHAVSERFGNYTEPQGQGYVWIHAVSLGETRAAAVLLGALRGQLPGMRLLLTHGTATGREEGAALLQQGDLQVWQPWDTPQAVRRFLTHFRPRLGILVETEIWPNLSAGCAAARIPLVLVNARLSAASARRAQSLAWLARPAYGSLTAVWAQTQADAQRLRALGAPVAAVLGNLKFDACPDATQLAQGRAWRAAWRRASAKPVVMFASSREGEELLLLQSLQGQALAGEVQWLIVPRHPQRFDAVAALLQQHGWSVSRRSAWGAGPEPTQVWLGDSLGELALYYGLSDLALLGGSFAPLGGQNLIEAAACACPVVMGPHTFNFSDAAQLAAQAGAAFRAQGLAQALTQVQALVQDGSRLQAARSAGTEFAAAHRGAAQKTAQAIGELLGASRAPVARG